MQHTSNVIRALIVRADYQCPTWGVRYSYDDFEVLYKSWTERPTESRVKPSPLIGNPTPQAKADRFWADYGTAKRHIGPFWNNCPEPDGYQANCWRDYYSNYQAKNYAIKDVEADPDWSLPLRLELKGLRQNVGNYLVEFEDTKSMFSDTVDAVADMLQCARGKTRACKRIKDRFNSKGGFTSKAAETYLLAEFGINPLMSSLDETIQRLNPKVARAILQKVQVSVSDSGRNVFEWEQSNAKHKRSYTWKVRNSAVAYVKLKPGTSEQFTMGNPLENAWEATPFSFIFDYLVPVGDWLSALDALAGWELVELTVSRKVKIEGFVEKVPDFYELLKPARWTYESHERKTPGFIPMPDLPRLDVTDSSKSLLNAVATLESVKSNPRFKT